MASYPEKDMEKIRRLFEMDSTTPKEILWKYTFESHQWAAEFGLKKAFPLPHHMAETRSAESIPGLTRAVCPTYASQDHNPKSRSILILHIKLNVEIDRDGNGISCKNSLWTPLNIKLSSQDTLENKHETSME